MKMSPPLGNGGITCISERIRHVRIPNQMTVFLPGYYLVQVSRFINSSECVYYQVSFFLISCKTRLQGSADLNFAGSYPERMQPVDYRLVFFVADSKMANVIAKLYM